MPGSWDPTAVRECLGVWVFIGNITTSGLITTMQSGTCLSITLPRREPQGRWCCLGSPRPGPESPACQLEKPRHQGSRFPRSQAPGKGEWRAWRDPVAQSRRRAESSSGAQVAGASPPRPDLPSSLLGGAQCVPSASFSRQENGGPGSPEAGAGHRRDQRSWDHGSGLLQTMWRCGEDSEVTVERRGHPQTAPEFRVAVPSRRATGQPAREQRRGTTRLSRAGR